MDNDKHIDESWKDNVAKEKEAGDCAPDACKEGCSCGHEPEEEEMKVSFLTYLTSMGYQAMIFLGEVPHPMTGQQEKNLKQAKFLIDTLVMMKEKTRGNLTPQEENFMDGTVYELQMKFVEVSPKGE
ncbi:MAG: DUF1844 domain-containing protein [Candidatus Omnitrophica bacterium]|nr:DUF1844 domain-containing protein [Candidatus Omnitrophota bacterium]